MAAIAPIAIQDGQAAPVTHTFNPINSVPPTYRRNGVAGQATIAQERLVVKVVNPKNISGVTRVQLELVVPVSELPTGGTSSGYTAPPAVAHEMKAKVELFFAARSDSAGRKDLRKLLANALNDAQIAAAIDNLETPY